MKTVLNVTKEDDTISGHVDEDVTTQELEYGLVNVMYHLIIRDRKVRGIRLNKNNFNKMIINKKCEGDFGENYEEDIRRIDS